MKKILSALKYIGNYKGYAALNILFNMFTVLFSLFSITLIIPFLDYLFNGTSHLPERTTPVSGNAFAQVKSIFYNSIQQYVDSQEIAHPGEGRMHALLLICMVALAAVFLKNICRYMAMYFLAAIRNGVIRDIRNNIFEKSLRLPLKFYSDERKGDIMSRISSDVTEIEWSVMSTLEVLFREPLAIVLSLTTLAMISMKLTLTVFIIIPIAALIIGIAGRSLRRNSSKAKHMLGMLMSQVEEVLGGMKVLKSFNAASYVGQRFRDTNEQYTRIMNKVYRRTDLSAPLSEFMGTIAVVFVMFYGGKLVLSGQSTLTGADLIGYIALFSQIIPPAKAITTAYYNIQKGLASNERINKILQAEETITDTTQALQAPLFENSIQFKDVTFAYNTHNVLQNINLTIHKGETVAIVGPSGGGKSTLVDLLMRFHDCTHGAITIDHVDVRNIALRGLNSLIAYVPQESILFNDSVANNIAFANTIASTLEIEQAAKVAYAHQFILQMPQGYQTNIGDKGNKLSGGQKQRIAIARAILKNAPIFVMDEATSALDTESEKAVQNALDNVMLSRTSIIIAHRLSTVQHANRILVINNGTIEQEGTHEQLYQAPGLYRKLCDMQELN